MKLSKGGKQERTSHLPFRLLFPNRYALRPLPRRSSFLLREQRLARLEEPAVALGEHRNLVLEGFRGGGGAVEEEHGDGPMGFEEEEVGSGKRRGKAEGVRKRNEGERKGGAQWR